MAVTAQTLSLWCLNKKQEVSYLNCLSLASPSTELWDEFTPKAKFSKGENLEIFQGDSEADFVLLLVYS